MKLLEVWRSDEIGSNDESKNPYYACGSQNRKALPPNLCLINTKICFEKLRNQKKKIIIMKMPFV